MQPATNHTRTTPPPNRAVSILARTLFHEMRAQGYSSAEIIDLSSELIDLVSGDLRRDAPRLADAAE